MPIAPQLQTTGQNQRKTRTQGQLCTTPFHSPWGPRHSDSGSNTLNYIFRSRIKKYDSYLPWMYLHIVHISSKRKRLYLPLVQLIHGFVILLVMFDKLLETLKLVLNHSYHEPIRGFKRIFFPSIEKISGFSPRHMALQPQELRWCRS
jgi:hypothetical protein